MEIAPILLAAGSTLFTSVNTYLLRRQSHRLKLLKGRYEVSLTETKKCIDEKDAMIEYVYKLYNIATELHQSLRTIVSVQGPVQWKRNRNVYDIQQLCSITVYIDTHIDVSSDVFYTKWDKHRHPTHTLHFSHASDDLHAYACLMAQFLVCVEERKHQKKAIHAFHAGGMHTVVEAFSHFLHNSTTTLHLPITLQKQVARQMASLCDLGEGRTTDMYKSFCSAVHEWKWLLRSVLHREPLHDIGPSSHDVIATLLSPTEHSNLLSRYLLSHTTKDSLTQPSQADMDTKQQDESDGLYCLSRDGSIVECVVTEPILAKQLCGLYERVSAFNVLYESVHRTLKTLQSTRVAFCRNQNTHAPLLVYIVWRRLCKHKKAPHRRTRLSSSIRKAIHAYIRESFSDEVDIHHVLRNQPLYTLLKNKIKANTDRLRQSRKMLATYTTQKNNMSEIVNELYIMHKEDIYKCVMQVEHPEWCKCLQTLKAIVDGTSDVIQQDMVFRRGLIEPT